MKYPPIKAAALMKLDGREPIPYNCSTAKASRKTRRRLKPSARASGTSKPESSPAR